MSRIVGETPASLGDIDTRVRHLEEGHRVIVGKLDQISERLTSKPIGLMEGLKTGLAILQTCVLLIGASVASIVYVSSNANNATIAVLQERQRVAGEAITALQHHAGWTPRVARAPPDK